MKIECVLRRKGGTTVNLGGVNIDSRIIGGKNYHFTPVTPGLDKDGNDLDVPHLCDVKDAEHLAQFLAIPSSFRIFDPEGRQAVREPQKTAAGESDGSGGPPFAGHANGGGGASGGTGAGVPTGAGGQSNGDGSSQESTKYNAMTDAELAEAFSKRTDRKPHHNAKRDTIIRAIESIDAKTAAGESDAGEGQQ